MEQTQRIFDAGVTLGIGGSGIAVITLGDVKDVVAVAVGVVTIVCLIYTTFFKKAKVKG